MEDEFHVSKSCAFISKNEAFGRRRFYSLPSYDTVYSTKNERGDDRTDLFEYIRENVIGKDKSFSGPYGLTKVVYCDYIASGRSLQFLEDFISGHVLPEYGNTHTTTTVTSLQTTLHRHEARDILRNGCNASEHDAVIFTGAGCTGAVHKLIHALKLGQYSQTPVVYVGPYEHHSNFLPWKETGAKVVRIPEDEYGLVDQVALENHLKEEQGSNRPLIGAFCAASNVTGVLVDVDAITILLHRYKAIACWDYATAAPYCKIDMNPVVPGVDRGLSSKDAVYFSMHKFVGGVQSPGVLIAKKSLFVNETPSGGGGGTVFFVRRESHRYLQEIEMREEGGTPAIVESIRAGLAFQLKQAVGCDIIMKREHELTRRAFEYWEDTTNLVILGSQSVPRLPVFSFLIRHPQSGLFLHYNFVCAILNDVFGVQARGGCACAGPYAQDLLGIDEELAKKIESILLEDQRLDRVHLRRYKEYSEREVLRPGFVRLNLPYFSSDEEISFILESVKIVAEVGWKLLPQYNFNPETGEWRHREHPVFKERKWLGNISYKRGKMSFLEPPITSKSLLPKTMHDCLERGRQVFRTASEVTVHLPDSSLLFDDEAQSIRYFLLPSEAQRYLKDSNYVQVIQSPYEPKIYCQHHLTDMEKDSKKGQRLQSVNSIENTVLFSLPESDDTPVSDMKSHNVTSQDVSMISQGISGISPGATDKQGVCKKIKKREQKHIESGWHLPSKNIFKPTVQAINEYNMIQDGDRILVCLSGGKDSLSLLHTVKQLQYSAKHKGIKFEFGAVTVDPQVSSYDPRPLIGYLATLNVPYFFESQGILETAKSLPYQCDSICSFCSRMKRGIIYNCARREGYNVLAMGQHLDDLAESFLMSVFHNGNLRTMKAHYTVESGDLRVIRPFVHVREKHLREFAEQKKLPVIPENCPACFEAPKERHRMKQLLAGQEVLFPRLYPSIQAALKPIMSINTTGVNAKTLLSQNAVGHAVDE